MLSDVISEIEILVSELQNAQTDDFEDASGSIENIASELRQQAGELDQLADKIREAQSLLD